MANHGGSANVYTGWLLAIADTLRYRGANCEQVFARAGMNYRDLVEQRGLSPGAATTRLWKEAVSASGDPALGLSVSRHIHATSFHALGFALQCSSSSLSMLRRMVRHNRLISNIVELQLHDMGETICVRSLPVNPDLPPCAESFDASLSLIVRVARRLSANHLNPLAVDLCRPPPVDEQPYRAVFGCELAYSAKENRISWRKADLDIAMRSANHALARQLDDLVEAEIRARYEQSVVSQVQALLLEQLPDGEPTQEKIAGQLHMSLRSLQRRLEAEHTSYKALLEATRLHLAKLYLSQEKFSLVEISDLLGFRDQSSFSRSFKRWMGMSPRHYREQLHRHVPQGPGPAGG